MPLIKEDPKDPRNRRISIILMFEKKSGAIATKLHSGKTRLRESLTISISTGVFPK